MRLKGGGMFVFQFVAAERDPESEDASGNQRGRAGEESKAADQWTLREVNRLLGLCFTFQIIWLFGFRERAEAEVKRLRQNANSRFASPTRSETLLTSFTLFVLFQTFKLQTAA